SQIAAAMGVEKGAQRLPAQAQGQVPQTAFDAMHGQGFVQGGRQELHHLGHQVLQQFGLEKRQFLCDAHGRASLSMDKASRARTTLSQGGPLGYQSSGRNSKYYKQLRWSGEAVTPSGFGRQAPRSHFFFGPQLDASMKA